MTSNVLQIEAAFDLIAGLDDEACLGLILSLSGRFADPEMGPALYLISDCFRDQAEAVSGSILPSIRDTSAYLEDRALELLL